jgi:DUF971 family protein
MASSVRQNRAKLSPEMATDPRTTPTGVRAPHGARVLEMTWADGVKHAYPHDILRGYCPCAGCQGHSGEIRLVSGGDLDLREIEQVGNYALSFTWGDGHASGIYTFRYLRRLGELVAERGAAAVLAMGEVPQA